LLQNPVFVTWVFYVPKFVRHGFLFFGSTESFLNLGPGFRLALVPASQPTCHLFSRFFCLLLAPYLCGFNPVPVDSRLSFYPGFSRWIRCTGFFSSCSLFCAFARRPPARNAEVSLEFLCLDPLSPKKWIQCCILPCFSPPPLFLLFYQQTIRRPSFFPHVFVRGAASGSLFFFCSFIRLPAPFLSARGSVRGAAPYSQCLFFFVC